MHKKIQVENVYHKFSNFPLFLNLEKSPFIIHAWAYILRVLMLWYSIAVIINTGCDALTFLSWWATLTLFSLFLNFPIYIFYYPSWFLCYGIQIYKRKSQSHIQYREETRINKGWITETKKLLLRGKENIYEYYNFSLVVLYQDVCQVQIDNT